MKNFILSLVLSIAVFSPTFVGAQAVGNELSSFMSAVVGFIDGVLIPLAFAIAFIFFVWGVIQFFVIGGSNDDAKAKGKSLIIYAIVGFVIIFSFYGIVNLLIGGLDLGNSQTITPPTVPR